MPLGRFLWPSILALGCSSSSQFGKPCGTLDGGPPGAGSSAREASATGGQSAGGAAGAGGTAASGGASTGAGGAARGGSAGTGTSGSAGTAGGGEPSSGGGAAGGATSGTGGGDAGGSTSNSGGAGTGGGVGPGDAGIVPEHCVDHRHDGDETDVDCGGSCAGCGPGSLCRTDADCGGVAVGCGDQCYCDTATSTCVYNDCYDNKTDALETDFDCGGPLCHPCELGSTCLVDSDCVSAACDVVTHACIAEQCADGRTDGQESDVDCGGMVCASCALGKRCHTSLDCPAGHVCGGVSKVCQ